MLQARSVLTQAIALAPRESGARALMIAQILGEQGRLDEARDLAAEGVSAGADPYEMDLAVAEAARLSDDPVTEVRALQDAIARRGHDVRAHYRLGLAYYRAARYPRAILALESATRVSHEHAPAWFYLGVSAEREYDFRLAEKAFARAVDLAPENPMYRTHRNRFVDRLQSGLALK